MKHLLHSSVITIAILSLSAGPAIAQVAEGDGATAPPGQDIIVTGTRQTGISAAESATPITLVGSDQISHVGQPSLNDVLAQIVPSFTAQAYGQDMAAMALSARLRGVNPNHTLVLVNGKRRHGTANLQVLSGPYQGSAAPDLDLISPASIKRIEVLQDGAAAQYGSDAIAGVINIILKNDSEGGQFSTTYGKYYQYGGEVISGSAHIGTKLGENGFFNATLMHRRKARSWVGGLDQRLTDTNGQPLATLTPVEQSYYSTIPGYPRVNHVNGDPHTILTNAQYNMGFDFGSVQFYSFGSYSHRTGDAYENVRLPNKLVASPILGVPGELGDPTSIVFAPNGFSPREALREDDFSGTVGLKGNLGTFTFDVSTTYGRDKNDLFGLDSANKALFIDTHITPRTLYDGFLMASEWTTNIDLTKDFDLGLSEPLNVAFGAEYRRQEYEIGQGDFASTYKSGGEAFPGFAATDAGKHTRNNKALYLDITVKPTDKWKVDGAVRYEDYSDFGTKVTWKATTRYDFSDAVAVRGTVSTGFRAPTMAEEFYSATNVAPTFANVQLPPNSPAAALVGFKPLRPETATNFSVGTVLRPAPKLTLTLDAYQIEIKDRILGSGTIYGLGGAQNFPAVTQAIIANGNILDPSVSQVGILLFENGATTRTQGVDFTASYRTPLGKGAIDWTLAANYGKTKVTHVALAPASLTPPGASQPIALFDKTTISNLETGSPRYKFVGSVLYTDDRLTVSLRETLFGKTTVFYSPDGGTYLPNTVKSALITDLEVGVRATNFLKFAVGANNLFNKKPATIALVSNGTGGYVNTHQYYTLDEPLSFSPYGINGGFYYLRADFAF